MQRTSKVYVRELTKIWSKVRFVLAAQLVTAVLMRSGCVCSSGRMGDCPLHLRWWSKRYASTALRHLMVSWRADRQNDHCLAASDLELVSQLSNGKVDLTYGRYVCISFTRPLEKAMSDSDVQLSRHFRWNAS